LTGLILILRVLRLVLKLLALKILQYFYLKLAKRHSRCLFIDFPSEIQIILMIYDKLFRADTFLRLRGSCYLKFRYGRLLLSIHWSQPGSIHLKTLVFLCFATVSFSSGLKLIFQKRFLGFITADLLLLMAQASSFSYLALTKILK
jgi:hypothetical protein